MAKRLPSTVLTVLSTTKAVEIRSPLRNHSPWLTMLPAFMAMCTASSCAAHLNRARFG